MTKRQFVEAYVLANLSLETSPDMVRTYIYHANLVWDTMGKEIEPDPEPAQPSGYLERLFGW